MNLIYIYADDLGRGMLSCYGQRHFKTPHLDQLARDGVRFDRAYGCALCAPARASLLTGYHDCHAGTWSYTKGGVYNTLLPHPERYGAVKELLNHSGYQSRPDEVYLAQIARQGGLATGQIGKLEWGFSTTPEELERHGWDYHFGYYDHSQCHGFYPPFLFENGVRHDIPGNTRADFGATNGVESPEARSERHDRRGRAVYSQDLFNQKIVEFIQANRDVPFFLYHPSQLPHGPIAVPELHPGISGAKGLTVWEQEYASMVLRLDDTVGLIRETLADLGLLESTLILFASDNGHETYYREAGRFDDKCDRAGRPFDPEHYWFTSERAGDVFDGNNGMAGKKLLSLEGGTRIPFIACGMGVSEPGRLSTHLLANYDVMATVADFLKVPLPAWKDGLSFRDELASRPQKPHDFVVFAGTEGPALVTADGWKVRYLIKSRKFRLHDLLRDPTEMNDLSAVEPDKLKTLGASLLRACDGNFYHGTAENHKALVIDDCLEGRGPEEMFPVCHRYGVDRKS